MSIFCSWRTGAADDDQKRRTTTRDCPYTQCVPGQPVRRNLVKRLSSHTPALQPASQGRPGQPPFAIGALFSFFSNQSSSKPCSGCLCPQLFPLFSCLHRDRCCLPLVCVSHERHWNASSSLACHRLCPGSRTRVWNSIPYFSIYISGSGDDCSCHGKREKRF